MITKQLACQEYLPIKNQPRQESCGTTDRHAYADEKEPPAPISGRRGQAWDVNVVQWQHGMVQGLELARDGLPSHLLAF